MNLPIEDGVYPGLSREDYDAIDRVNWSSLKYMKRSPAHFQAARKGLIKKDSDGLRVGTAIHLAALEPDRFGSEVVRWTGKVRSGAAYEQFEADNAGKVILTQNQYADVLAMAKALREHEDAGPLLRGGQAELTVLFTWEGVQCKARIDRAHLRKALLDLKSTKNASPDDFGKTAYNLDYLGQAAFYSNGDALANGGEVLPFILIAQESEEPYLSQVYGLPDFMVDAAEAQVRGHLRRVVECRKKYGPEKGPYPWPGYSGGLLDLQLPPWAKVA